MYFEMLPAGLRVADVLFSFSILKSNTSLNSKPTTNYLPASTRRIFKSENISIIKLLSHPIPLSPSLGVPRHATVIFVALDPNCRVLWMSYWKCSFPMSRHGRL